MPISLKERSSRLQMFARLKSDNEAKAQATTNVNNDADTNTNAPVQLGREPERYQSPVPAFLSAAERRELADAARVPVPGGNVRQPTLHERRFSQGPPESAQQSHSQSPASRQIDIFTGSQLGDSFMNSGLTTPQYEPSEADPDPMHDKKNTMIAAPTAINARAPPPFNFDKRFGPGDNYRFQIGEDFRMKPAPAPRPNYKHSYLNDGFNNGGVMNGYSKPAGNYRPSYTRPESSPEKQPGLPARELPIREFKIRHVSRPRPMEYDGREQRGASPVYGARGQSMRDGPRDFRHGTRFRDLIETDEEEEGRGREVAHQDDDGDQDDGTSTVGGREDAHAPSRITRHLLSPQRAAIQSAIAATVMPPFKPSEPRGNKRRRESLDYDDMALSNMSYAELQKEPFDFDPSKATTHVGLGGNAGTLTAKLEQYQHQSEEEQRSMFANMDVDDWEEAGDWFADQFAEIMHKMREARRNKRRVVKQFEQEAASREEAVRLTTEAFERKLDKMKQNGERVVDPNDG